MKETKETPLGNNTIHAASYRWLGGFPLGFNRGTTMVNTEETDSIIAALTLELQTLNHTLTVADVETLRKFPASYMKTWAKKVLAVIAETYGAQYNYRPMYPNFPTQVKEASQHELWLNATLHYFGDQIGARILPHYEKDERPFLPAGEGREIETIKIIRFETEKDASNTLLRAIYGSKKTWNTADIDLLTNWGGIGIGRAWSEIYEDEPAYIENVLSIFDNNIPNKANFSTLLGLHQHNPKAVAFFFTKINTIGDVLRAIATLSGEAPNLTKAFLNPITRKRAHYAPKSFTRAIRRTIIQTLNNIISTDNGVEDFYQHAGLLKKVARTLHPFDNRLGASDTLKEHYSNIVRNIVSGKTWNSKVQHALDNNNVEKLLELLTIKPGEFTRRLFHLTSTLSETDTNKMLTAWEQVAPLTSTTVLWQLVSHTRTVKDNNGTLERSLIITANGGTSFPRPKKHYGADILNRIEIGALNAIREQYATRPTLGKVYANIDPDSKYAFPISHATSSGVSKAIVGRGSRVPIPAGTETVRLFIYWKDHGSRLDIDLSATQLDSNFETQEAVWYGNLSAAGMTHSGDITSAPEGASEFIDIDLKHLPRNAAYVAFTIHSYSQQLFSEMAEVFGGVMFRNNSEEGEVYEPATADHTYNLTAPSTYAVVMALDVEKREIIIVDLPSAQLSRHSTPHNVTETTNDTSTILSALFHKRPIITAEVLQLNIEARASEIVATPEEADTVITFTTNGRTNLPLSALMAEYL